jgi:HNH endonuclease
MNWIIIKDFPNYSANELGEIKNNITNKKIKPGLDRHGYYHCSLTNNGIRKNKFVHRLVCDAFNTNVLNKPVVNHINGIKKDNRVENLEWCTISENCKHAFKNGLASNKKATEASKKIFNEDVIKIRKLKKEGKTLKEIGLLFNVYLATIGYLIQNKTHKNVQD